MIDIHQLTVRYGEREVISGVDLRVRPGEFVTLLGPSGCGKSTMLRSIAGFVPASAGRIVIDGHDVTGLDPEDRGAGFVFQNYALFPHLSVARNVAFGLRARRLPRREIDSRVEEILATTGLTEYAAALPAELSGGQQQRVAIARVLVTRPSVLLMDEPLSNLDSALRTRLRAEIARLHRELKVTIVYVTHDQEEALALSDRIAVMREGRIDQMASPTELYVDPATSYVCTFVGAANVLTPATSEAFGLRSPEPGLAHVRPEHVDLRVDAPGPGATAGVIEDVVYLGSRWEVTVKVADTRLTCVVPAGGPIGWQVGDRVPVSIDPADVKWLAS